MSRPAGLPRERFLSEHSRTWLKDIGAGIMLVAFMAGLVTLAVEKPNGLVELRQMQFAVVGGQ